MSTKKVFRTLFSLTLAFTLAFSSCFCALAEEKAVVQVNVYDGVATILYEDGTMEEVDPAAVSADILSEFGIAGIEMSSATDDSELAFKGTVTVTNEDGSALGILNTAEQGITSQLSIEGPVDVTSTSEEYSRSTGAEVEANGEGSTVSVDMVGDITATAESENGGAYVETINASSSAGATVEMKVDGNASAASSGTEGYNNQSTAVEASADGKGSSTDVEVTGETTGDVNLISEEGASVSFESGKGVNGAVYVEAMDEASVTLTVSDGGIEAEDSASLDIRNAGADVKADVTGDIKSTGNQGITIEQRKVENETKTKINEDELPNNDPYVEQTAFDMDGETVTLYYVDFSSDSTPQEDIIYRYSVDASLDGEEKFDDETHPDKKDMYVSSWWYNGEEDLFYREYVFIDDDGNETYYLSTTKPSSERTFESADKITTKYEEQKANTQLSVDGNVSVESKESTTALNIQSDNSESTLSVSVVGDLSAKTTEKEFQYDWEDTPSPTFASGLQVSNDGGIVNIDITGNIDVNGAGEAAAVSIWSNAGGSYSLKPVEGAKIAEKKEDDWLSYVDEDGIEYYGRVLEDGRQVFYNGTTMQVCEFEPEEYTGGKVNETNLTVTGDVTSNDIGLGIGLVKEQKADVLIDGTLEGKNTSIVLNTRQTIVGENLTLTVWEVIPDKDNNIVSRETWDNEAQKYKITGDAETEKALQYIIRINPEQTDIISAGGTKDYNGYDVAHEGDTVTLKLNIPAGYEIIGAYGDVGQNVSLLRDANGNYYLVVPRGGGVELSVKLGKAAPAQAPVQELFRIRDKAETTQIIFYSNGSFHARLLEDSSKACTGRFRAVDGGIVLINNGETEENGMKITRNTETNLYDLLFHFAEKVGVTDSYTFELEENDVAILLHISK